MINLQNWVKKSALKLKIKPTDRSHVKNFDPMLIGLYYEVLKINVLVSYMNLVERFNTLNIQMPLAYCADDKLWIKSQLMKLKQYARKKAIEGYAQVYQEAFDLEPVPFRKENKARRAANTRLRLFVDRYKPIHEEKVSKPPIAKDLSRNYQAA